jgi:copper resistance protein D
VPAGLLDPLIWARFIHFAATISVTGAILFFALVALPALREAKAAGGMLARTQWQIAAIAWIGLGMALVSGAAWLLLQAAQIADLPPVQAWSEGAAWTILSETDFGHVWTLRLALVGLLAVILPGLTASRTILARASLAIGLAASAALVGTLAWAGHAAADTGGQGIVHLAADILHLVSAAAWVGALVPLALLLRIPATSSDQTNLLVARAAVPRFSTLGMASVSVLAGSGLINTWVLAGSRAALTDTDYGRLLLFKIALFLLMLLFAAFNRLRLTPRLEPSSNTDAVRAALAQIRRNTLIEAGLGAIVILVVSLLGTLPPGLEALD